MDARQAADLPEGVAGKRLPPWILPKVDNETRGKQPGHPYDLDLIIEGLDSNTVPQENTNKYAKFTNNLKHIKAVGLPSVGPPLPLLLGRGSQFSPL